MVLHKENNLLSRTKEKKDKEHKKPFKAMFIQGVRSLQFLRLVKNFHELINLNKVGPFSELKCLLRNRKQTCTKDLSPLSEDVGFL